MHSVKLCCVVAVACREWTCSGCRRSGRNRGSYIGIGGQVVLVWADQHLYVRGTSQQSHAPQSSLLGSAVSQLRHTAQYNSYHLTMLQADTSTYAYA
ncbi:hypothetical protein L226DRAFT_125940 [Lentinus tigrinus ALCF2SS1-7]|uniref:Uncharacterized protein n=1 Tax=Lentinus tigrinus ALCF2SS1-6 TaxID=1328759 RepID=A0A5C2SUR0_9APHY|nr:hypothetical protein L227DRAFT_12109 [Lentinus tigrinus ALCF2SS1-6]RPD80984.1 hypothetical protein L226DRAFT_125940 [Lentinus tigrinus ALCF2SS1-7]